MRNLARCSSVHDVPESAFTIGGIRIKKVAQLFVLNMAAYNLVRMRSLGQVRLQGAR